MSQSNQVATLFWKGPMTPRRSYGLRRAIKFAISVGFFLCSRARDAVGRLTGRKPPATCVILYYHAVSCGDRTQFARQMDQLVRWTTPIATDNHQALSPGTHYAGVTFDDGILSAVKNGIPELIERKIPATIFVVANVIDAKPKWATFGPQYDVQERIATLEQLKYLPTDLITIGSHTMTHPWLPALLEAEARRELSASRERLGALLNRNITLFSFPYGALNERLVDLCREAGYERVFTIVPTLAFSDPNEFMTGRVAVEPTDWRLEFRLKLLGAYRWLPPILKWKAKFHRTSNPQGAAVFED